MGITHKKTLLGIFIITALFSTSLFVRRHYLFTPLGDQHGRVTASSLMALDIYFQEGAKKHWFRIPQSYPGIANRYIYSTTARQMSKDGVAYYTTYPSFAVVAPYALFSLFHISPSVWSIEAFNLLLHYVSSLFFFLLILRLSQNRYAFLSGIIGTACYIFFAPLLWLFSETYSWDIAWHYVLIIELYVLCLFLFASKQKDDKKTTRLAIALGVVNFFANSTEFQGIIFAIFLIAFSMLQSQNRFYKKLFLPMTIAVVASLGITFVQACTVSGVSETVKLITEKIHEYSTLGCSSVYPCNVSGYVRNYQTYYPYIVVPSAYIACIAFLRKKQNSLHGVSLYGRITIFVVLFHILLHDFLFLPDSMTHEFPLIKVGILFAIIIAFFTPTAVRFFRNQAVGVGFWIAIISITLVYSVQTYTVNRSSFTPTIHRYKTLGERIAVETKTDEPVFIISSDVIQPQIEYYAKRTIKRVSSKENAINFLKRRNIQAGQLYTVDKYWNVIAQQKIALP